MALPKSSYKAQYWEEDGEADRERDGRTVFGNGQGCLSPDHRRKRMIRTDGERLSASHITGASTTSAAVMRAD